MDWIIYHNNRCAKSRQCLSLMRELGLDPQVVDYLKQPLDVPMLKTLMRKLGLGPEQFIRQKESLYKQLGLGQAGVGVDLLLQSIADHPILLERPIVIHGEDAILARPPEKVVPFVQNIRAIKGK